MIQTLPSLEEQKAQELDALYDKLSSFVCEHGPLLLTRGMTPLEANTAILSCLELLWSKLRVAEKTAVDAIFGHTQALKKLQIANDILDRLRDYSTGMAVLCEDRIQELVEKFNASV